MQRLLAFVLLASMAVSAQTTYQPAPSSAAHPEDEIVQLEQQWLAAGHAADPSALDVIEADEFIATTPAGDVVTKNELMPQPGGSNRLPKLSLKQTTVRVHGDTAVLMARVVGEQGGPELNATNV